MKITTRTGDRGTTSLLDGTRVGKDDLQIECLGQLDELSAHLGLCKACADEKDIFTNIQEQLMQLMTLVSMPADGSRKPTKYPPEQIVATLQRATETMEKHIASLPDAAPFAFTLPGTSMLNAALHLARTKARTCERRLVALAKREKGDGQNTIAHEDIVRYLNRLSDYIYCLSIEQ